MMEPDYEFHRELQGYARVHRIGQKNPESHSYRLINALDPLEQSILERQSARGEFPGRPDKVEVGEIELLDEMEKLVEGSVDAVREDVSDQDPCSQAGNSYDGYTEKVKGQEQQQEEGDDNPYAYADGIYDVYRNYEPNEMDDETRVILEDFPSPGGKMVKHFPAHYIPSSSTQGLDPAQPLS